MRSMKNVVLIFILYFSYATANEFTLNPEKLRAVAIKVWHNECRGTVDGLISWNPNEEFPSLGIGHFIWYPTGKNYPFEETFPSLIAFLDKALKLEEKQVPSWIKKGCPWTNREDYLKEKSGKKVAQLREFLTSTIELQMGYLYERFSLLEPQILAQLSVEHLTYYQTLKSSDRGFFALIDYAHFKGSGLTSSERYLAEGWGLVQVIKEMSPGLKEEELLRAFIASAKRILTKRVENSPTHRNERRFLSGWYKRVESYHID